MKRMKRREYRKLVKKKKNINKKIAHGQSVKPREKENVLNYVPAMDYLTGYTDNINTLSNEMTALSSVVYQPSTANTLTAIQSSISSAVYQSPIVNDYTAVQDSLSTLESFESILPNLDNQFIISPPLDYSRYATLAYSGLSNLNTISELASVVTPKMPEWYNEMIVKSSPYNTTVLSDLEITKASNTVAEIMGVNNLSAFSVQSSLSKATEYSLYTEKSLSSFQWTDIGQRIGLSDISKNLVGDSFIGLSSGYSELVKSFEVNPVSYVELYPSLTKLAPIELFTGANLLEVISTEEVITPKEELLKKELQYENEYSFNIYLPKIHSGLLKMWMGAVETINSDNSDKVRQVSASMRELYTHVMHQLAPDNEVKKWTTDKSLFHEGKPTRKARLQYICRNISNVPFNKFVEKDIKSTLEFIDLFQSGTHSIESGITQSQLLALKSKAETNLKFLLEIEFGTNR